MSARKMWTKDEEETLAILAKAIVSNQDIAAALKRPVGSVAHKRSRLGLPPAPAGKPAAAQKETPASGQMRMQEAIDAQEAAVQAAQVKGIDNVINALNGSRRAFFSGKDAMELAAADLKAATARLNSAEQELGGRLKKLEAKQDALEGVVDGLMDLVDAMGLYLAQPAVKRMLRRYNARNYIKPDNKDGGR